MPAATTGAPTSSSLRMGWTPSAEVLNPARYPFPARPRTRGRDRGRANVPGGREAPGSGLAAGSARELGRSGGGGLVLLAHGVPDLLAVDRDRARGLDADANGIADDLHHVDDDVVAEHDLLAGTAGDDEHLKIPPWKASKTECCRDASFAARRISLSE